MTLKRGLIVGLVFLNVLLLGLILVGPGVSQSQAQVMGATERYVPFSANYAPGKEAIFIIDLEKRGMGALYLVPAADGGMVLQEFAGRDLLRDFGRSN
jgi:hypothetical protein